MIGGPSSALKNYKFATKPTSNALYTKYLKTEPDLITSQDNEDTSYRNKLSTNNNNNNNNNNSGSRNGGQIYNNKYEI